MGAVALSAGMIEADLSSEVIDPALAENLVRAGHAACSYS
jgi:hypothetical protein